jgi:hypothetical protein
LFQLESSTFNITLNLPDFSKVCFTSDSSHHVIVPSPKFHSKITASLEIALNLINSHLLITLGFEVNSIDKIDLIFTFEVFIPFILSGSVTSSVTL